MPRQQLDRKRSRRSVTAESIKSARRQMFRRIVTVLAITVLIAPLTVAVSALSRIDHRWPDILAQFAAPSLVVTAAFAVVLAIMRLKTAFAVSIVVACSLLAAVWPQWGAERGRAQPGAQVLTLYSANLYYRNTDVAAITASVAEARPDIIVFIEASRGVVSSLDRVLVDYPHRLVATGRLRRGTSETVIASRYPLTPGSNAAPDFDYALARVETPLGPVNVVGAHLTRPWPYQVQWEQIRQARGLTSLISDVPGPTIVAGDFNSISSGRIGRQIQAEAGLKANPGWPGTWPAQLPAFLGFTIDQVYRTPDLAVVGRRVGLRTGSDHRPVVTRLTLAEPRPAS